MITFLKFGASWVLPPGIFFVILFGVGIYCWRKGQRPLAGVLLAVTFVFYLLSTGFVSELLVKSLESRYVPPSEPCGDVVVVLGGGALKDTPDVDGDGQLCGRYANRVLTGARLAKKWSLPVIISGGQLYEDSGKEAEIAKRAMLTLGVPQGEIISEDQSLTTSQNAKYTKEILQEYGFQKPVLVTSAFHMPRAVQTFNLQGVEVIPYPADYLVNVQPVFHYKKLRPNAEALDNSVLILQEYLRILVLTFFDF